MIDRGKYLVKIEFLIDIKDCCCGDGKFAIPPAVALSESLQFLKHIMLAEILPFPVVRTGSELSVPPSASI